MWAHPDVLDNGIAYLKANASRMLLIKAYAAGDSYAAVTGNKLAEVSLTSADWTISSASGGARQVVSAAGKVGAATAAADAGALFWAFTDGSSKVLWVTDAVAGAPIVPGTSYAFPALPYTAAQPIPAQ